MKQTQRLLISELLGILQEMMENVKVRLVLFAPSFEGWKILEERQSKSPAFVSF